MGASSSIASTPSLAVAGDGVRAADDSLSQESDAEWLAVTDELLTSDSYVDYKYRVDCRSDKSSFSLFGDRDSKGDGDSAMTSANNIHHLESAIRLLDESVGLIPEPRPSFQNTYGDCLVRSLAVSSVPDQSYFGLMFKKRQWILSRLLVALNNRRRRWLARQDQSHLRSISSPPKHYRDIVMSPPREQLLSSSPLDLFSPLSKTSSGSSVDTPLHPLNDSISIFHPRSPSSPSGKYHETFKSLSSPSKINSPFTDIIISLSQLQKNDGFYDSFVCEQLLWSIATITLQVTELSSSHRDRTVMVSALRKLTLASMSSSKSSLRTAALAAFVGIAVVEESAVSIFSLLRLLLLCPMQIIDEISIKPQESKFCQYFSNAVTSMIKQSSDSLVLFPPLSPLSQMSHKLMKSIHSFSILLPCATSAVIPYTFATNNKYVYLLCSEGLIKIGTGFDGSAQGRVYEINTKFGVICGRDSSISSTAVSSSGKVTKEASGNNNFVTLTASGGVLSLSSRPTSSDSRSAVTFSKKVCSFFLAVVGSFLYHWDCKEVTVFQCEKLLVPEKVTQFSPHSPDAAVTSWTSSNTGPGADALYISGKNCAFISDGVNYLYIIGRERERSHSVSLLRKKFARVTFAVEIYDPSLGMKPVRRVRLMSVREPKYTVSLFSIGRGKWNTNDLILVGASTVKSLTDESESYLYLVGGSNHASSSDGHVGAAWTRSRIDITYGFDVSFTFSTFGTETCEGLAFVIHNDSSRAIGRSGSGIGYDGIANSLAIEFDCNENKNLVDPCGNHVAVMSCGRRPNSSHHRAALKCSSGRLPSFSDGKDHCVRVKYLPSNNMLKIWVDAVGDSSDPLLSLNFDIVNELCLDYGRSAWFGFTAAGSRSILIKNWVIRVGSQLVSNEFEELGFTLSKKYLSDTIFYTNGVYLYAILPPLAAASIASYCGLPRGHRLGRIFSLVTGEVISDIDLDKGTDGSIPVAAVCDASGRVWTVTATDPLSISVWQSNGCFAVSTSSVESFSVPLKAGVNYGINLLSTCQKHQECAVLLISHCLDVLCSPLLPPLNILSRKENVNVASEELFYVVEVGPRSFRLLTDILLGCFPFLLQSYNICTSALINNRVERSPPSVDTVALISTLSPSSLSFIVLVCVKLILVNLRRALAMETIPEDLGLGEVDTSLFVSVTFCWTHGGDNVGITGSFFRDARQVVRLNDYEGIHYTTFLLPRNHAFSYRYIVDGVYCTSPDQSVDATGHHFFTTDMAEGDGTMVLGGTCTSSHNTFGATNLFSGMLPLHIKWYATDQVGCVSVAGDFNSWQPQPLVYQSTGVWQLVILVKPGKYQYKFIVDNKWTISDSSDTVMSADGFVNNIVNVSVFMKPLDCLCDLRKMLWDLITLLPADTEICCEVLSVARAILITGLDIFFNGVTKQLNLLTELLDGSFVPIYASNGIQRQSQDNFLLEMLLLRLAEDPAIETITNIVLPPLCSDISETNTDVADCVAYRLLTICVEHSRSLISKGVYEQSSIADSCICFLRAVYREIFRGGVLTRILQVSRLLLGASVSLIDSAKNHSVVFSETKGNSVETDSNRITFRDIIKSSIICQLVPSVVIAMSYVADNLEFSTAVLPLLIGLCREVENLLEQMGIEADNWSQSLVRSSTVVVESTHPYKNGKLVDEVVSIPHALRFLVLFDSKCASESEMDVLTVKCGNKIVGEYSGRGSTSTWPKETLEVVGNGEPLCFSFKTGHRITDWGYKVTVIGLVPESTLHGSSDNWLVSLQKALMSVSGMMSAALIRGHCCEISPDYSLCDSWLNSTLFRAGLGDSEQPDEEIDRFLDQLINATPGTVGGDFVSLASEMWPCTTQQRLMSSSDINLSNGIATEMVERALVAVMLKHKGLVADAIHVAKLKSHGNSSSINPLVTKAWMVGYRARKLLLLKRQALHRTSAELSLMDAHAAVCREAFDKCLLLLRLAPRLEFTGRPNMPRSATAPSMGDVRTEQKLKQIGSKKLNTLSEGIDLESRMDPVLTLVESDAVSVWKSIFSTWKKLRRWAEKSNALRRIEEDLQIKETSLTESVLLCLKSAPSAAMLIQESDKRDIKALYRIKGLNACRLLVAHCRSVTVKQFVLRQLGNALRDCTLRHDTDYIFEFENDASTENDNGNGSTDNTDDATGGIPAKSPHRHFTDGVRGCKRHIMRNLYSAFSKLFAQLAIDLDKDISCVPKSVINSITDYKLLIINAWALDFDDGDHEMLFQSKISGVLSKILFQSDSDVCSTLRRNCWRLFRLLVLNALESLPKTMTTTTTVPPVVTPFQKNLIELIPHQLRIGASKFESLGILAVTEQPSFEEHMYGLLSIVFRVLVLPVAAQRSLSTDASINDVVLRLSVHGTPRIQRLALRVLRRSLLPAVHLNICTINTSSSVSPVVVSASSVAERLLVEIGNSLCCWEQVFSRGNSLMESQGFGDVTDISVVRRGFTEYATVCERISLLRYLLNNSKSWRSLMSRLIVESLEKISKDFNGLNDSRCLYLIVACLAVIGGHVDALRVGARVSFVSTSLPTCPATIIEFSRDRVSANVIFDDDTSKSIVSISPEIMLRCTVLEQVPIPDVNIPLSLLVNLLKFSVSKSECNDNSSLQVTYAHMKCMILRIMRHLCMMDQLFSESLFALPDMTNVLMKAALEVSTNTSGSENLDLMEERMSRMIEHGIDYIGQAGGPLFDFGSSDVKKLGSYVTLLPFCPLNQSMYALPCRPYAMRHVCITTGGTGIVVSATQPPENGVIGIICMDFPIPSTAPYYYFEVSIVSKMPQATVFIGLLPIGASLNTHIGCCNKGYSFSARYGYIHHESSVIEEEGNPFAPSFCTGSVVGCGYVKETGSLFFTCNGVFLGEAFTSVPERLFPAVSIAGNASVIVNLGCSKFVYDTSYLASPTILRLFEVDSRYDDAVDRIEQKKHVLAELLSSIGCPLSVCLVGLERFGGNPNTAAVWLLSLDDDEIEAMRLKKEGLSSTPLSSPTKLLSSNLKASPVPPLKYHRLAVDDTSALRVAMLSTQTPGGSWFYKEESLDCTIILPEWKHVDTRMQSVDDIGKIKMNDRLFVAASVGDSANRQFCKKSGVVVSLDVSKKKIMLQLYDGDLAIQQAQWFDLVDLQTMTRPVGDPCKDLEVMNAGSIASVYNRLGSLTARQVIVDMYLNWSSDSAGLSTYLSNNRSAFVRFLRLTSFGHNGLIPELKKFVESTVLTCVTGREIASEEAVWHLKEATRQLSDGRSVLTFENDHPYGISTMKEEICIPWASSLLIVFDERCHIEKAYDFLSFFADRECSALLAKYNNVFFEPLLIQGNRAWYKFVSIAARRSWGFKFSVYPVGVDLSSEAGLIDRANISLSLALSGILASNKICSKDLWVALADFSAISLHVPSKLKAVRMLARLCQTASMVDIKAIADLSSISTLRSELHVLMTEENRRMKSVDLSYSSYAQALSDLLVMTLPLSNPLTVSDTIPKLLIISATFGSPEDPLKCFNVTNALQNLVDMQGGSCLLIGKNKNSLPGLQDPCATSFKLLKIKYVWSSGPFVSDVLVEVIASTDPVFITLICSDTFSCFIETSTLLRGITSKSVVPQNYMNKIMHVDSICKTYQLLVSQPVKLLKDSCAVVFNKIISVGNSFTITMWLRITGTHSGLYRVVFFKGFQSFEMRTPTLLLDSSTNGFRFSVSTDSLNSVCLNSNGVCELNIWTHVAVQCTGRELRIFLDGINDARKAIASAVVLNNHLPIFVGQPPPGVHKSDTPYDGAEGSIAELRYYNRILEPSEIRCLASVTNMPVHSE